MNARDVVIGAAVEGARDRVWHVVRKEWGEVACYLDSDTAEVVFDGSPIAVPVSVDQLRPWDVVVT